MHQVCTREGMMCLNLNVKTAGTFIGEMASYGAATIHICKGSGVHSCISDEVNNVALSRVQYFTLAFMKMFIRDGVHS
jgi:hypothetical protein